MAYKSRLPLCGALFLWAAAVALKASVESALVPLDNEDTENATEVEHDEGVVRVDRLWSNIEDKLEAIYSTIWDSQLLENDTMKISDFSDGLVSSLVITILSELGDKTFFITAILAARHSRYIVYCGAMSALILMTLAATGLGYAAQFVPRYVIHYTSICLFILFGLHMLYEGVQKCRKKSSQTAEDIKDEDNRSAWYKSPFIKAFILVLFAEWGDRSQLATILLSATKALAGVFVGAVLAHGLCTFIATVAGRILDNFVPVAVLTILGGLLFFVFAGLQIATGYTNAFQSLG